MAHGVSQGSFDVDDGGLVAGAVLRSRYVLEEIIGRGGHSLVFRAKDLHRSAAEDPTGDRIALKALQPAFRGSSRAIERLGREFRQMQHLAHPGIARVFDLDCDGDIWFITMELIRGQSAADWLRTAPCVGDAMQVIDHCAEALRYAHAMHVIHGDLKPSNILITSDRQVKLIDFGSVPSPGDRVSYAAATPRYASPQVLAGIRAEERDDVFSLACVSYEILSEGQRPFGDQSALDAHRARLCPAAIPGMPVEVFAVLTQSLSGDREQRAASPEIFRRDLLGNASMLKRRTAVSPRGTSRRTLRRASLASAGAAAACSLVLLLPAARKIVAGDEDVAVAQTTPDAGTASASPVTELAADRVADHGSVDTHISDAPLAATAAPRAAGLVTFEDATLLASGAQALIAIPVRRLQSTRGSAAVEWQLEGGQANVDYKSVQSQIVRFSDGEAVRSIFIPLEHNAASPGAPGLRSFTVTLRRVDHGVRLGAVTRINVTIVPQPVLSDLSNTVAASFVGR
ncbi:MAG TPA: serine/threonine-protein kinase [Steroidobacteraceae bacterium]|jgi:predicted Ser/Thr protein kinase|nr:serine/threonine-protein kinase [Steroidobacteraceae bacterium]